MSKRELKLAADLVLTDAKAYMNNSIVDCNIAMKNGKIARICGEAHLPRADRKIDLKGLLVLPGLIDVHVHLRDEGKAYKEDFYSGTAAAAAGGITTVLDMPNNQPVTMSAQTLRARMEIAEKRILVNVGFYSEFPKDSNELREISEAGAIAFKLFMIKQVGGLNIEDDSSMLKAFKILSKLNLPTAVHAEDAKMVRSVEDKLKQEKVEDIDVFLQAHSESAEESAINHVLAIAKDAHNRVHFCHLSTIGGLKIMQEAKSAMAPVTCEVTPHHLLLSSENLKTLGGLALTLPPLRDKRHAKALWIGLKEGVIDVIASDHAPHTLEEKNANSVRNIEAGISGLETTLPLLLTEVNRGNILLSDVARLMAERPARIFGLKAKGALVEGSDADLTVIDLKRRGKIDASKFHSKAKFSPFNGWQFKGKPVKTFVNGELIMDDGEIVGDAGVGKILRRNEFEVFS